MEFKKIDLHKRSKKTRMIILKIAGAVILSLILGLIFLWFLNSSSTSVTVFNVIFPKNPLKSTDNRVNILLLGNAGGMHDGPQLTDSIIVASYNLNTKGVILISIPRDLWLENIKAKINASYALGARTGNSLKFTEDKISEVLGIPIHYGVRLDFNGFARAVDTLGGVEVDIPTSFDDYDYPIEGKEDELCDYTEEEKEFSDEDVKKLNLISPYPLDLWYSDKAFPLPAGKYKVLIDPSGNVATDSSKIRFDCRFEHIHFDEGKANLDGATALKFVRSRMGTNKEGSDFARSRRQQLVLQSFRNKLLSKETLFNPARVVSLAATFGDSIDTDIPAARFVDFYKLVKSAGRVDSIVLGDLGKGKSILITPSATDYGGAFVLIPENNDFSRLKKFIEERLKEQEK